MWEVSSVASWIMHQALKTQEEIDPSETKLVRKSIDTLCSNLFWLVQRMAVLESMLSDIEQTNYRTKTVRITLFNHTNNEKNEAQDGIYDSQVEIL